MTTGPGLENQPMRSTDTMDTKKTLGARVRELRDERRWSQEYLALRAGLHPTALSRIERGERTARVNTIVQVARALGVTMGELFTGVAGALDGDLVEPRNERGGRTCREPVAAVGGAVAHGG